MHPPPGHQFLLSHKARRHQKAGSERDEESSLQSSTCHRERPAGAILHSSNCSTGHQGTRRIRKLPRLVLLTHNSGHHPLLPRCVVTLPGAHLKIFLESGDFDGAVAAIGFEVSRVIGDYVLAAQLVINGRE